MRLFVSFVRLNLLFLLTASNSSAAVSLFLSGTFIEGQITYTDTDTIRYEGRGLLFIGEEKTSDVGGFIWAGGNRDSTRVCAGGTLKFPSSFFYQRLQIGVGGDSLFEKHREAKISGTALISIGGKSSDLLIIGTVDKEDY